MSRTLNNQTNDNAGYLQGVPVSTSHPNAGDVLQYNNVNNDWEPHSVSALPSVQAIQNIGTGDGIWSNTTGGTASLKSLIAGPGISLTDNTSDITINNTGALANIYNTDGTLTGTRTVTLGGYKLEIGPHSATSPADIIIDPTSNLLSLFSYNGQIDIGDTTQTSTNIKSNSINLYGGTSIPPLGGLTLDATGISFPQQPNGVLKTASGILSSNAAINDLSNVAISTATANQVLLFNGTNWINSAVPVVTQYQYYNLSYQSTSVTINPAIANTHYILENGGTITIAPLNPGEHIMVTVNANAANVTFSGTSFVENSYTGGGTSNPTFSLLFTTIELQCVYNSGQTYYTLIRVSQNNNLSSCTLNGTKVAAINNLNDIPDVSITSPAANQVLLFNGTNWINSNQSNITNLLYSGLILGGSCLQNIFDYVTIADFTYSVNSCINLTITLSTNAGFSVYSGIWDIQSSYSTNSGNWCYVQPRATNNYLNDSYYMFVKTDTTNPNKFYIGFQRGPSTFGLNTSTNGYYFNIYSHMDSTQYSYNIYTSPTFTSTTAALSNYEIMPRQEIHNFSGVNLTGATLTFSYNSRINYNIKIQIWTEIDVPVSSNGTLTTLLNGITINTTNYHNIGSGAGVINTRSVTVTDFGNAMLYFTNNTLLAGNNNLTFTVSTGNTTNSNYNVSVTLSL